MAPFRIALPAAMTTPADSLRLPQPLTDKEFELLDRFLCSEATADEVMMIDTLDGYLTALALGPVTVPTSRWLPGIWGPKDSDAPQFASDEQAKQITGLILRLMSGIVGTLATDPDAYEPILDSVSYEDKSREYLDGEMWCYGFMAGVSLSRQDWQPLFENEAAMQALLPIYLLGSDDATPQKKALTKTPAQREKLAEQIAGSVAQIYRFWQPARRSEHESFIPQPLARATPKVGRNDMCPCGSGKKYKKCCGASSAAQ